MLAAVLLVCIAGRNRSIGFDLVAFGTSRFTVPKADFVHERQPRSPPESRRLQTPDSEIAGKLASSSTRRNMPKPSECIDRVDSPSWSFFVLEIGEGVALGRPPAQGILNQFEL